MNWTIMLAWVKRYVKPLHFASGNLEGRYKYSSSNYKELLFCEKNTMLFFPYPKFSYFISLCIFLERILRQSSVGEVG